MAAWLTSLPDIELSPVDDLGNTPLDDALREKQEVVVVLLQSRGAVMAARGPEDESRRKQELAIKRRRMRAEKSLAARIQPPRPPNPASTRVPPESHPSHARGWQAVSEPCAQGAAHIESAHIITQPQTDQTLRVGVNRAAS